MSGEKEKPGLAVVLAIIGAVATIVTACITGFFGFLPVLIERALPENAPLNTGVPAAAATTVPTTSSALASPTETHLPPLPTSTPNPTPSLAPSFTPTEQPSATPTPLSPLLFASKIAPNGQALDPGTKFKPGITDLYAVFPAGMAPPGTTISAEDPQEGAYYAFLRVADDSSLSKVGWRWIHNGETVNAFEAEVAPGNDFWLSYFNYQDGGIFGAAPLVYGSYTIVITLGGNPSISGDLEVGP